MAKTVGPDEYEKWGKFIGDHTDDFYKFFGAETPEDQKIIDDNLQKLQNRGGLKGWICPVCGRGLSPYTSVCPCKGSHDFKITVTC